MEKRLYQAIKERRMRQCSFIRIIKTLKNQNWKVWNLGQNWLAQTQVKYRYNVRLTRTLARRKGGNVSRKTRYNPLKVT